MTNKKAEEQAEDPSKLPAEIRIKKVDNKGLVTATFSKIIKFPANLKDFINEKQNNSKKDRRLTSTSNSDKEYLTLFVAPQLEADEGENEKEPKLVGWQVTELKDRECKIKLDFKDA